MPTLQRRAQNKERTRTSEIARIARIQGIQQRHYNITTNITTYTVSLNGSERMIGVRELAGALAHTHTHSHPRFE